METEKIMCILNFKQAVDKLYQSKWYLDINIRLFVHISSALAEKYQNILHRTFFALALNAESRSVWDFF
jgi:hypothetical protein